MMAGPVTKGWCPSLFEPMAAGDGLLVRIKPRVGGVSPAQLRVLADAGATYGSGRIELTNRANFQLRGFSAASASAFAQAMLEAGLANADPAVERRRNLLVQVSSDQAVTPIAQGLEDWLERDGALHPLAAKFGFAIGDTPTSADIGILCGGHVPIVVLAGGFAVAAAAPVPSVQALTHAFLKLAGNLSPRPARMRGLVAALGAEAILAEAGLPTEIVPLPHGARRGGVGPMADAFGLGLPFGVQDSAMLHHAADLAERFGNGRIRTTAARSLVLMGTGEAVEEIAAAASTLGFITRPDDPRLNIAACAGRPACPNAWIDARAIAAGFSAHWAGAGMLHVSACAKGCAHPGAAAVALVATGAEDQYDVVLDGRAGDIPHQAGITLAQAIQLLTEKSLYA
jgi:precorrin-3B synthase